LSSNISLRTILNANKLTKPNFLDWNQNMRIIIKQEKMMCILENPILNAPSEDVGEEVKNEHQRHVDDDE